jgi:hypothetical protein
MTAQPEPEDINSHSYSYYTAVGKSPRQKLLNVNVQQEYFQSGHGLPCLYGRKVSLVAPVFRPAGLLLSFDLRPRGPDVLIVGIARANLVPCSAGLQTGRVAVRSPFARAAPTFSLWELRAGQPCRAGILPALLILVAQALLFTLRTEGPVRLP